MHKTQDEDKQIKKHNTICVGHHYAQDTRRREANKKTQHKDTTIKKHNITCVGHHYAQDTRQTKNKKHNITCVGHHYAQDTRRRQTNKKTQHNMCWTPLYTRHKTKRSK